MQKHSQYSQYSQNSQNNQPKQPNANILAVKTNNGATICWYETKTLMWTPDGVVHCWLKRPTFKDAFYQSASGRFYDFRSDGSVYARFDGQDMFWPAEETTTIYDGEQMEVHVCHGEYYFDGEACACHTCDNCGQRCLVYGSYFCGSRCEDEMRGT